MISGRASPFIAALRHDRLDAPWVIERAMNRELFGIYVESQLTPTPLPGDVFGPLNRTNGVRGLTPRQPVIAQKLCRGGDHACEKEAQV